MHAQLAAAAAAHGAHLTHTEVTFVLMAVAYVVGRLRADRRI